MVHTCPVTALIINAVVPLASVLTGAALTYWFNVRTRKRTYVEDLFNQAITAVAVADASKYYIRSVAKPQILDDDAHRQVHEQIAKAAVENHLRAAGEAQAALARVLQYEPRVKRYYQEATAVINYADTIIPLLAERRNEIVRSGRRRFFGPLKRSSSAVEPEALGITDSRKLVTPFGIGLLTSVNPSSRTANLGTAMGGDQDEFRE